MTPNPFHFPRPILPDGLPVRQQTTTSNGGDLPEQLLSSADLLLADLLPWHPAEQSIVHPFLRSKIAAGRFDVADHRLFVQLVDHTASGAADDRRAAGVRFVASVEAVKSAFLHALLHDHSLLGSARAGRLQRAPIDALLRSAAQTANVSHHFRGDHFRSDQRLVQLEQPERDQRTGHTENLLPADPSLDLRDLL